MNVDMNKKSKYFNMTAEECIKYHVSRCRIPSLIGACIILTLALILIYLMLINEDELFFSLLFYILGAAIFFATRLNSLFRFRRLHDIIHIDCDPKKYLDVMQMLLQTDKKKRAWSTLHICIARAYYGLKDYDAMKDCLDKINFKKKAPVRELMILNLRGNFYLRTNQLNELEKCRAEMLHIKQENKLSLKENIFIDSVFEMWDYNLCIKNKDIETAQKLIDSAFLKVKRPYEIVRLHFSAAELELISGKTQQAIEHLKFVKTYGNTMAVQKEASKILDEL